jgi:hypothetical protein
MQDNVSDQNDLERRLAVLEEFLDAIPTAATLATVRAIVVTLRRHSGDAALDGADAGIVDEIETACSDISRGLRKLTALSLRADVNEVLVLLAAANGNGDVGRGIPRSVSRLTRTFTPRPQPSSS